jgi:hypothetical protein
MRCCGPRHWYQSAPPWRARPPLEVLGRAWRVSGLPFPPVSCPCAPCAFLVVSWACFRVISGRPNVVKVCNYRAKSRFRWYPTTTHFGCLLVSLVAPFCGVCRPRAPLGLLVGSIWKALVPALRSLGTGVGIRVCAWPCFGAPLTLRTPWALSWTPLWSPFGAFLQSLGSVLGLLVCAGPCLGVPLTSSRSPCSWARLGWSLPP